VVAVSAIVNKPGLKAAAHHIPLSPLGHIVRIRMILRAGAEPVKRRSRRKSAVAE
jgi:hypothetical protein